MTYSAIDTGALENGRSCLKEVYRRQWKTAPFGDIWGEFLNREGVAEGLTDEIESCEMEILAKR